MVPWPLDEMGFKWLHVTLGYRNSIERFFRVLKERTRRFYNNLPSTRRIISNRSWTSSCSGTTTSGHTRDWEGLQWR
jgi:transposase-like protein